MDATASLPTVVAQTNAFLAVAREKAKNGITWSEFGELFVDVLHLVVTGLDSVSTLTGEQKKEVALTAAASIFDSFADKCVPLAAVPAWMLIRPAIRLLILSVAAGVIQALLRISRSSS